MRLRQGMIADYLAYITSIEIEDPEDVTEDMTIYDQPILSMAAMARSHGNLDKLQMAIDSLISDPDGRLPAFYGSGYPFTDEELIDILDYAYALIWPGEPLTGSGGGVPVEFVAMSEEQWNAENVN